MSPMEIERGGPSYTVDTLAELRPDGDGARADLWFILSTEALAGLPTWREPDRILELARLAVDAAGAAMPSALDEAWVAAHFPGREDRVRFLAGPLLPISGSVVRRRVGRRAVDPLPRPRRRSRATSPTTRCTRNPHEGRRPRDRTRLATAPRPDGLPARETAAPKSDRAPLDIARRIVELAEDKKAADIVLLDLGELTTVADAFVICSGGSERQISAIADGDRRGPARRGRPADRPRGHAGIALGAARLTGGDRPRVHAARARVLPARAPLVRREDGPARPVGGRVGAPDAEARVPPG